MSPRIRRRIQNELRFAGEVALLASVVATMLTVFGVAVFCIFQGIQP